MADLNGFYRAFGAAPSGPAAERPDHAGCELEFLSFLVLRRLDAEEAGDAEGAAVCRQAEDAFLREHLGRWFPTFCRDVARASESPIYRLLALAGERVVVRELAARELEPAPLPRRARTAVEGDSVTCGRDLEPEASSARSGSELG
jgi:TorA maturation chaperone TorD